MPSRSRPDIAADVSTAISRMVRADPNRRRPASGDRDAVVPPPFDEWPMPAVANRYHFWQMVLAGGCAEYDNRITFDDYISVWKYIVYAPFHPVALAWGAS